MADLDVAREAVRDLERERDGVPPSWTDDIPPAYRAEFAAARLDEVFRTCGRDLRLLGIECDEPPCFMALDTTDRRGAHADLVQQCPAWRRDWTQGIRSTSRTMDCPDGSQRVFWMLSPGTGLPPPADPMEMKNNTKRQAARAARLEARICR